MNEVSFETYQRVLAERDEAIEALTAANDDGCGWKPKAEAALALVRDLLTCTQAELNWWEYGIAETDPRRASRIRAVVEMRARARALLKDGAK